MWRRSVAGLVCVLAILAQPAQAAVDEKFKKGWETAFEYIESSFAYGITLDTGLSFLPTKYVPYVAQSRKIMARVANEMQRRLAPLGIDATKYFYKEFDGVQVLRVAYALEYAKANKLSALLSSELLAYSLCPWMVPQCTSDVKAAIYKRRGWSI